MKTDLNKNVGKCCLTVDSWTSNANESFLGVTCHYVDEKFNLKNAVLNLKYLNESHTAVYIKAEIEQIIEYWNLKDKVYITVEFPSFIIGVIFISPKYRFRSILFFKEYLKVVGIFFLSISPS